MIILESERLFIRSYKESDLPEYFALFSNEQNMYFLLDDIFVKTIDEARESLLQAIEVNEKNQARRFCIVLKAKDDEKPSHWDAPLIGGCGYDFMVETPIGKVARMGWFILPEFQNQGYVTEAVRRILEFAFNEDNCIRVETGCFKDNNPSRKVMEKAGFRKEAERIKAIWHDGQMKDRLEFAMNKEDYIRFFDIPTILYQHK